MVQSFNSLMQRLFVEPTQHGHELSVQFGIDDAVTREAVDLFRTDIVLAALLRRASLRRSGIDIGA